MKGGGGMSAYAEQYQEKLISREKVTELIRPRERVMCYGGASGILTLLDENRFQFDHVELYTMFLLNKPYGFLKLDCREHLCHYSTFVSPAVRESLKAGDAPEIILSHYSDTDALVRERVRPSTLMVMATPMDDQGYFSMGFNSLGHMAALESANQVIVQVNPKLPRIFGECNRLHISEVTAIFEEETALHTAEVMPHSKVDLQAATLIAERIPDGATIQIGVGRVPDAIGSLLFSHKDLGVHTELFSQSLMELMKAGVVNNSKKTLLSGKSIFSFAGGARATQEIYDYTDENPLIEMRPISWVNDPRVIAENDRFISVNSALAVDLTGQVCSETIGLQTFSGPGGQLDFVRGARWSKGGQSYIVINSATEKKDGTLISKISLALPLGSAVTTPRADVDCIVTEYGVAELRFKSLAERAKALISIAHPEFREELTRQAKEAGYFI